MTASSRIMFIVSEDAGTPDKITFKNFECRRTGMLSLKYGDQKPNMVNIYMPNDKSQQKEVLINLRRALKNKINLKNSELVILGDWNFVEDQLDRSPQHTDNRRVDREMTKLKMTFNLIDGWHWTNPRWNCPLFSVLLEHLPGYKPFPYPNLPLDPNPFYMVSSHQLTLTQPS